MEPYFLNAGYRNLNSKRDAKNILIIRDANIGDFILTSAVIREIRRIYSKSYITLLINKSSLSMAENCPYINEVVPMDHIINTRNLKDFFKFFKSAIDIAKYLLKRRIDISFNFGQYPVSQLLAYMSGTKELISQNWIVDVDDEFKSGHIPMNLFDTLSTFNSDFKNLEKPHFNECNLYILQDYSKNKVKNKKIELWFNPMDTFVAETIITNLNLNNKRMYAIVMGSSQHLRQKRWSASNYAKLIEMILKEEEAVFIILGGSSEIEEGNMVKSLVNSENVINLTNRLEFRQSAAVLNYCDCYIGNDTGMIHAAAALGIPILSPNCFPADITMTTASFPQRYYPYDVPSVIVQPSHSLPECRNSSYLSGCKMNVPHCINQITPEKMFSALNYLRKRILENAKEPLFYS